MSLEKLTQTLLDVSRPAYSLRDEVLELASIFESAGGLRVNPANDIAHGEKITPAGVAISPVMAAMCIDDFARTVQFIRGIHSAITGRRSEISDRPIRVLYAGCGPWATLAVPLMSVFSANEARFTLIDVHDESIASAKSVISSLGLSDRVDDVRAQDVLNYSIDAQSPPDIIVVEMMRAGLEHEPQVSAATHLTGQAPNAILIPHQIRIDLALVNSSREFAMNGEVMERDRVLIGTAFVLRGGSIMSDKQTSLSLPQFDETRYRPMLLTTVNVYGEHVLKDYDSGITCPREFKASPGARIEFSYEVGSSPRLRAEMIN